MSLGLPLIQTDQRLQEMYSHLLGLYQLEDASSNKARYHLKALPESIQQKIFWHVWDLFGCDQEDNYGEIHVFDSLPKLQQVIQKVAFEAFDALSEEDKRAVGGRVWYRSGSPNTSDAHWGETHAKDNTEILFNSLQDNQILKQIDKWVKEANYNKRSEREAAKYRMIEFINNSLRPTPSLNSQNKLDLSGLNLTSLPPIQLSGLQFLDLSNNRLQYLPEEIGQFDGLQSLNLSNNQIVFFPKAISQLDRLQSLDLSNNWLHNFSAEIGQLKKLQSLMLSNNKLSKLPEEIGQLDRLQHLNLSNNQLSNLPAKIGQLDGLQFLDLSNNQLSNLPTEIGQLDGLQFLNLSNNQLSNFSNEIVKLIGLKYLNLSNNGLNNLSSEICKLNKLDDLNLSNNELTNFSEEICQLSKLKYLNLSKNKIDYLPAKIGQLGALEILELNENQLTHLPLEIGQLGALKVLMLISNQLTHVSPEIGQLGALKVLSLGSNRLTHLPAEIGRLDALQICGLGSNPFLVGLPNQVFDLPFNCSVELQQTGLSRAVLSRLREICTEAGYQGPRISYSMEEEERRTFSELPLLNELISQLFSIAKIQRRDFLGLSCLPTQQELTLRSWLSRLSDTADYKKKGAFQENFAKRIVHYLIEAENNLQFRESFLNIIQDASTTCGDRVSLSILYLDLAAQLATINRKEIQRLGAFLLGTVWPIEILEKVAREKIPTLRFFDEIEVYLGYPLQLRKALDLKIGVEDMLYFRCSALTQKDLDEAKNSVQTMQADEEKRLDFLLGRKEWMEALQTAYLDQCKKIETETEAAMDNCQNPEDYKKLDAERKEKWAALTAWALVGNIPHHIYLMG